MSQVRADGRLKVESQYANPAKGTGSVIGSEEGLRWEIRKLLGGRTDDFSWFEVHTFGRQGNVLNIAWEHHFDGPRTLMGAVLLTTNMESAKAVATLARAHLWASNWRGPYRHADGEEWDEMWTRDWGSAQSRPDDSRDLDEDEMGHASQEASTHDGDLNEDDAGVRTVDDVFDAMQIDDEWSERGGRAFTWWPHRVAQRIWASEPVAQDGFSLTRVSAETDVFHASESDWQQVSPMFEAASMFASMSGYVWDEGVVRLRCGMIVHDEVQPFAARVLKIAALDQVTLAEQMVSTIDQLTPALSGDREEPDEMLLALEGLPGRDQPSAWRGPYIGSLAETLSSKDVFSMGDDDGLTVEFPYGPSGGPAATGGMSNMLRVTTKEAHPRLGSGLLMRLSLREAPTVDGGPLTPLKLNQLEWEEAGSDAHLLGSWCTNPDGGPPVFVSFFPSVLADPNALVNLVMSMGMRSRWASNLFDVG